MRLRGKFIYLNTDLRTGVKDPSKQYYMVALMQGAETTTLMCMDAGVYNELQQMPQFSEVNLEVEYNVKYGSARVVSVVKK